MAGADIKIKLPPFLPTDIPAYERNIRLWNELVTGIPAEKRALALVYSVPEDHPSNFKEYLLTTYTIDELKSTEGVELFITALKQVFAVDSRVKKLRAFEDFTNLTRSEGEDVQKFIARFKTSYTEANKAGLSLNESSKALFLLKASGLNEAQKRMVVTQVDFDKTTVAATPAVHAREANDTLGIGAVAAVEAKPGVPGAFPQLEAALRLFLGDVTKSDDSRPSSTLVVETGAAAAAVQSAEIVGLVKDQLQELVLQTSVQQSRRRPKKKFAGSSIVEDGQGKTRNPVNKYTGETLKCFRCDSIYHLIDTCPKKKTGKPNLMPQDEAPLLVNTLGVRDLEQLQHCVRDKPADTVEEVLLVKIPDKADSHFLVIDTGSKSNVGSETVIDSYVNALDTHHRQLMSVRTPCGDERIRFRFGGGRVFATTKIYTLPIELSSKQFMMEMHAVAAENLPMLWGRKSLQRCGAKMNLENDTLQIDSLGVTVPLEEGISGDHYVVHCLPRGQAVMYLESCLAAISTDVDTALPATPSGPVKLTNLGTGAELLAHLKRIHWQYGHLSQQSMTRLMVMAKLHTQEVKKAIQEVYDSCHTCRRFVPTPSRPKFAQPAASRPFQTVSMDLAELKKPCKEHRYILYISCAYHRVYRSSPGSQRSRGRPAHTGR